MAGGSGMYIICIYNIARLSQGELDDADSIVAVQPTEKDTTGAINKLFKRHRQRHQSLFSGEVR